MNKLALLRRVAETSNNLSDDEMFFMNNEIENEWNSFLEMEI